MQFISGKKKKKRKETKNRTKTDDLTSDQAQALHFMKTACVNSPVADKLLTYGDFEECRS